MSTIRLYLIIAAIMVGGFCFSSFIFVLGLFGADALWVPGMFAGAELGILCVLYMEMTRTGLFAYKRRKD
jgi:hypothetical protein